MAMEGDLITYLLASPAVATLLIRGGKVHVHAQAIPQPAPNDGSLPAVVWRVSREERMKTQDGATGLVQSVIELRCIAEGLQRAIDVFEALRARIENLRGQIGNTKVRGVFIDAGGETSFQPPQEADEVAVHGKRLELTIWHKQAA